MARLSEFEYGQLPEVMYHGAGKDSRDSIAATGLTGGHVTPHYDLAAEYGSPDIWEVRKHPNMTKDTDGWDPKDAVWAGGVPPTHVRRVGHVIWHQERAEWAKDQGNEVHWHKAEDCPLGYDTTWDKNATNSTKPNNVRPHPTEPTLMVGNW